MLSCIRKRLNSDSRFRKIAEQRNRKMHPRFTDVPAAERIIFVPQCLRNSERCRAKECGSYYLCAECGACKIGPLNKRAKELGYQALFILKGGRTVEKLIAERKPRAIVGVACFFEGVQGMKMCEEHDIPVQFVPLTKDGCVDTDVDLDELFAVLECKK